MAKRYNINSISGTEFTYQLYANMSPQISGESTVDCTAEATPGDFYASFTVTGAAVPANPFIQQVSVVFYDTAPTEQSIFTFESYSPSFQPPALSYTYNNGAQTSPFSIEEEDQNGNYEIYKNGTNHILIKDGVVKGSISVATSNFATSATVFYNGAFGGDIINVVLGS